jgi:hypothetical protein
MPRNDSICALPPAPFSGACGYHSHEQPPDPPFSWLLSTCGLALGEMRLFDPVRVMWFQSIRSLAPFDPPDSRRACRPQKR